MTDDTPPDAVDLAADAAAPRRRRVAATIVAVLAIAAVLLTVAWGADQRGQARDAADALARQRDAVLTATAFVEALMSYDHQDLDAQQAAVERFASDRFRTDFDDAFTTEVRDQISAEQAVSTVEVQDAWLSIDPDSDTVSAIVHARSTVTSQTGVTVDLESYLRVRLICIDGQWKVDDLISLGTRDLTATSPTSEAANISDAGG